MSYIKNLFSKMIIVMLFLFFIFPSTYALINNSSMKIFAVSSSDNAMQATLDIKITPGTGKTYSSLDSIVGDSTQESEKNAVIVAESKVKDIKGKYNFYFDIESNAYSIDGPSAGGAMALLIISMLNDVHLSDNVSMTGTITRDGHIGNVGGIYKKAKKAAEVGIKLFMIPLGNRKQMVKDDDGNISLVDIVDYFYQNYDMKIVEVETIDDVLNYAYKDINSIDINSIKVKEVEKFKPKKITYSLGLDPMNKLVKNYLNDANSQLTKLQENIETSSIKDTSILQNMLSVINYSKKLYDKSEDLAAANYLYSSANYSFLVLVNVNTVNEIVSNPSILSKDSEIFKLRLKNLKEKIDLIENRTALCSLERIEWCIAAKQRITLAENKLNDLLDDDIKEDVDSQSIDRITDYSYALEWANIANDFLDIGITNSDVKFVESNYFKEIAQNSIIEIENKLMLLDDSYKKNPEILRRLNAAKVDLSKGWYVTSLFDSSTCLSVLTSKEENEKTLFDINTFTNNYNIMLDNLRSIDALNKKSHIWSKLYFDHAMYFYNNYEFYKDKDKDEAMSNIKTANSIFNIAKNLYDVENKVIEYYNNADIDVLIKDSYDVNNKDIKDSNSNTVTSSSSKTQSVYVINKEKSNEAYIYMLFILFAIVILIVIEFERFKKVDTKEQIKKKISDIDEKLLEGRISPFTHKELRHRYLEDLRRLKLSEINKYNKFDIKTRAKFKKNLEKELLERQILELQLRHKELVQSRSKTRKPRVKTYKKKKK